MNTRPMKLARLMKATALGFAASLALAAQVGAAEILRVNSVTPNDPSSSDSAHLIALAERVKQKSGGELELEIHWSSSLIPQAQAFDAVTQGLVDAHWISPNHFAGQIPEADLFSLPFDFADHADFVAKNKGCINAILDEQFAAKGVKYISGFPTAGTTVVMAKESVTTVEGLKGKKIRVFGAAQADLLTSLGASPVYIPLTELEVALNRGIVDGFLTGWASMATSPGLRQESKFVLWPPLQGSLGVGFIMNKARFESLSPDLQSALLEAVDDDLQASPSFLAEKEEEARKLLAENSVEVSEFSSDELGKLKAAAEPVWAKFVDKVAASGGDEGRARAEKIVAALRNGCGK